MASLEVTKSTSNVHDEDLVILNAPRAGGDVMIIPEAEAPVQEPRGLATRISPRRIVVTGELLTDALAAILAFVLSDVLALDLPADAGWVMIAATGWLGILAAFKAYESPGQVPVRSFVGAMGVAGLAAALIGSAREPVGLAERLAGALVILASIEFMSRSAWSWYCRRARTDGRLRLRTAIVGSGDELEALHNLLLDTDCDMLPVAWIPVSAGSGAPFVDLSELREGGIECLLVTSDSLQGDELDTLRRTARRQEAELRVVAKSPETMPSRLRVQSIGHHAVVSIPRPHLTGSAVLVKRTMDVIIASLAFLFFLPLMLAMVIGVKLTSPGPAFFRQTRVTKGGRRFQIVKFRTMRWKRIEEEEADAARPFFKLQNDPRLTKAGRVIRRLSVDELPQLWNVLKGEMSLVGPRPLPVEQVAAHPELLGPRHEVLAGMTGWWQVNGRSDLPPEEAIKHDLFYIENWSVALDVQILTKTVKVLLGRRGAY
jgi:exopolysaccharide biosynthesis polyprenyl glycosylphosphotransferase